MSLVLLFAEMYNRGLQVNLNNFCFLHRYKENEKLPEHVKEKLHCLSTILGLLANPTAHHLQPH